MQDQDSTNEDPKGLDLLRTCPKCRFSFWKDLVPIERSAGCNHVRLVFPLDLTLNINLTCLAWYPTDDLFEAQPKFLLAVVN